MKYNKEHSEINSNESNLFIYVNQKTKQIFKSGYTEVKKRTIENLSADFGTSKVLWACFLMLDRWNEAANRFALIAPLLVASKYKSEIIGTRSGNDADHVCPIHKSSHFVTCPENHMSLCTGDRMIVFFEGDRNGPFFTKSLRYTCTGGSRGI